MSTTRHAIASSSHCQHPANDDAGLATATVLGGAKPVEQAPATNGIDLSANPRLGPWYGFREPTEHLLASL